MKTYSKKASEVNHVWIEIDASSAPLGRVATVIATRLTGKYKPTYTPSIDDGDYVIVVNADKVVVTGNKEEDKIYRHYSGYPSGMTSKTLKTVRSEDSARIITDAVKGMLPRNKLAAERLKRLRVFTGTEHTHAPQQPVKVEVK